jgi:hypothetical protein
MPGYSQGKIPVLKIVYGNTIMKSRQNRRFNDSTVQRFGRQRSGNKGQETGVQKAGFRSSGFRKIKNLND